MTQKPVLYHNPRCSKSREAKKILEAHNIDHETVLYLDEPLSLTRLKRIAKSVEGGAQALLRPKEAREEGWDPKREVTDDEILVFIKEHPRTLQRPILVLNDDAVIGRPPEQIKTLLAKTL